MSRGEKMVTLLRRLKKEMNGAVTGGMEERGIVYPLNYGVSTITIREISAEYAPDNELAKLLFRQDVRELKLAALHIADPALVTADELTFWAEGIINSEVAEYAAFALLGKTRRVDTILRDWLASEDENVNYAALMTGTRALIEGQDTASWDFTAIDEAFAKMLSSHSHHLWNGIINLVEKLSSKGHNVKVILPDFFHTLQTQSTSASTFISDELAWRIAED